MKLALIVAMAENGVMGRGGQLPWHLPRDLARFKQLTMGHTIVMGRKTYESIGRPLPGRRSIVITSRPDYRPDEISVPPTLARRASEGAPPPDVHPGSVSAERTLARRASEGTPRPDYHPGEILVAPNLPDALRMAGDADEVFIIGGARVFREALPLADRLYVTRVHAPLEGDVFFPEIDARQWRLVEEIHHAADERNEHSFSFLVYDRVPLRTPNVSS